jgi:hypothetical protein
MMAATAAAAAAGQSPVMRSYGVDSRFEEQFVQRVLGIDTKALLTEIHDKAPFVDRMTEQ